MIRFIAGALMVACWAVVTCIVLGVVGGASAAEFGLYAGLLAGLYFEGEHLGWWRVIWQSPAIYYHAGLYLKVKDKRYRVLKFGPR